MISFKRLTVLLLTLLLGLAFSTSTGLAQTVNEYTTVDSLKVGDTFDLSITLNKEQGYDQIIFPDTSRFSSPFEMRSRSQFKVSSFKDSVYYKLQYFGSSDTTLPPLPVYLVQGQDTTTLYTNPIPIGFRSVLAKDDEAFRPLKPIYTFAAAWWPYIVAFLLLCIAAYYLYGYFTKEEIQEESEAPKTFTPSPFVNPLTELQNHIDRLERVHPQTREEFKDFYIELGDAIRRYFEDLHHIPAMESTSREILQKLRNRSIDQDLISVTRSVLQEADMVKFAKFTPSKEQAQRALQKAHNFLNRAEQIDAPRVEHLQREHQSKMETKREKFEQQQNEHEVHA